MSYSATRRKRFTAGVLAGAMAMTVMPILGLTGTAGALEPATGDGSVCEDAPETNEFTDVTAEDPSVEEIECLVATEITTGVTDDTYEPNSPVTRRQMALFLVRLADTANQNEVDDEITELPVADGETEFTDIADEAAEIQQAIDRLADAGITEGVTATEFRPAALVTRRQMAKFIVRLQDYLAGDQDITPNDPEDAFTDDEGDSGEAELNILAAEGIFLGDGEGNVNPGDDISRRQMANVIIRKGQYLFEQGLINRFFVEDDSNATFGTTTPDMQLVTLDTNGDAIVQYTFTGLDPANDYTVSLFPCADDTDGARNGTVLSGGDNIVTEDGESAVDGVISFNDVEGGAFGQPDDIADEEGDTSASNSQIDTVGFTTVDTTEAQDQSPGADGTLVVRIEYTGGGTSGDCAIPVVYQDIDPEGAATDNNDLDLDDLNPLTLENDNEPAEPFGVGPAFVFYRGEAPTGESHFDDVIFMDLEENFFILDDGYQYFYDEADSFNYDEDYPLTMAQFESYLSLADMIDYNTLDGDSTDYSRTGANVFELTDDIPGRPDGVELQVVDADSDGAADDVLATATPPADIDGDIAQYCFELRDVSTGDFAEDATAAQFGEQCTDFVSTVGTGDAPNQEAFLNVAEDSTVVVRAYAYSDAGDESDWSWFSNEVTVNAVADDTTAPTMINAEVVDAGTAAVLDPLDGVILDFSENLEVAGLDGTSQTFTITDVEGETFLVTGTVVLSDNVDDATVNLTDRATIDVSAVTKTGGVGDDSASLPAEVDSLSGEFEDPSGNLVDLATSTDVVLDIEA